MKKITVFLLLMTILYSTEAQNVGIGTSAPSDKLQVNAPSGINPLLIQVNGVNKLRVNASGGTTIGSTVAAPANGLYVAGVTNPYGGIRSSSNPISIQSNNDSVEIIAGTNRIVVSNSGGIRIIAAGGTSGITIDAGAGVLNLKGKNVNIKAAGKCTLTADKLFTVSTDSTYFSTINGNLALYAAKNTGISSALNVSVTTGVNATIITGAAMELTTGANFSMTTGGITNITSSGKIGLSTNNSMDVLVGSNYTLSTTGSVGIRPGTSYDLTSQGAINIKTFGVGRITGNMLLLNNGTKPAARATDPTQTLYTNGVGIITTGSGTVLIGD